VFKPRILIAAIIFLLLASGTGCAPSTTRVQAHGAIKEAGETMVYTALSLVNEAELDITMDDVEIFSSALNLLDSSKAARARWKKAKVP